MLNSDGSPSGHRNPLRWLRDLGNEFGAELLLTIFCSHHLLGGVVGRLTTSAMDFSYRALGVSGPEMQVYVWCAALPFSMKSLIGMMSDGFPLCGYHKTSYILLFGLVSTCACVLLCQLGTRTGDEPAAAQTVSLPLLTFLLFLVFFQMALSDLLVEGKYAQKVKVLPARGPDLMTFVWGGMSVAGLFATAAAGVLIDRFGPGSCYLLATPFAAAILWPAACNFLQERKEPGRCRPDLQKWHGRGRVPFALALIMGIANIALASFSLYASSLHSKFYAASAVGILNLVLFSLFLRPSIARINAFFFLQNVFHISINGASFYFFTDNAAQFPNGPHFSAAFYVTGIGVVGSLFRLVGMMAYNLFLKDWKIRPMLVLSSLLYGLLQCLSALVYARWNLSLNIPDHLFMVASSATQSVIAQFSWMPLTVVLAQLVPDGLETTIYALLASSLNLGGAVASYSGALLLQLLGVNPSGTKSEGEQFESLWLAAVISACAPCVPLLLVRWLVPDARQTEKLLEGDSSSATEGSVFEHLSNRLSRSSCEKLDGDLVVSQADGLLCNEVPESRSQSFRSVSAEHSPVREVEMIRADYLSLAST